MSRLSLKYQLVLSRGRCAICGKLFRSGNAPDMHESIITRGNAKGSDADIMVAQNCVLVHHGECHEFAQTSAGRDACIRHLIDVEGYSSIINWLEGMRSFFKSGLIDERIRQVVEVENGKNNHCTEHSGDGPNRDGGAVSQTA